MTREEWLWLVYTVPDRAGGTTHVISLRVQDTCLELAASLWRMGANVALVWTDYLHKTPEIRWEARHRTRGRRNR